MRGPSPAAPPRTPGAGIARSSLVNLAGLAVYGVTSFLLVAVITRRLGTEGAGAILTAIAVFSVIVRTAMLGADVALVRFTSRFLARERGAEVRTLYRVALGPVLAVSVGAGVLVLLFAGPVGRALASEAVQDDAVTYLRVLAPFIPIATTYQVLEGASRGFGTMLPSVVVERFGRSSLLPFTVLGAIVAGGGATLVGLAWAGPFVLALVPMALWVVRLVQRAEAGLLHHLGPPRSHGAVPDVEEIGDDEDERGPGRLPRAEVARRFWRFAIPRAFAGMFAFTIAWIDTVLLGALEGSEAVGIYAAATRWLIMGNFAGTAVTQAFAPQISHVLATSGTEVAGRAFQRATGLFIMLAWPAYLGAMVFAPFLLAAFGDDFTTGAVVVAITGAGFLVASAMGPIDMLVLMAGRSRLSLINAAIALVANVTANLILIPPFGIRGAAWAWTVSLVIANVLPAVQMWVLLRVHAFGPETIRALVTGSAVGLAFLGSRLVFGTSAVGVAVAVALGGTVAGIAIATSPDHLGLAEVIPRLGRRASTSVEAP